MRILRTLVVFTSVGVAYLQAAADPRLLGLMIPDAKSIAGADIEQCRNSPLGQFLLARLIPNSDLDQLKSQTGFDPRTDLTEVIGSAAGPQQVLIAGKGSFQPDKIVSLAKTAGAKTTTYLGNTLIGVDGQPFSVAFLNANTVVAGATAMVQGAIDRWVAGGTYAGPLASKVAEVSGTNHAWSVATGITEMIPGASTNLSQQDTVIFNLISSITQAYGGVHFGDTQVQVKGRLETRSAQDAQSMTDFLRFLATMAPNPALTSAVTFTNAGSQVDILVSLTEQQVEQLFQPELQKLASR